MKKMRTLFEEPQRRPEYYDPDEANYDTYAYDNSLEDREYNKMLMGQPHKKLKGEHNNSFFEQDPKYKGKKYEQPEEEEQEQPNQLAQAYNKIRQSNKIDSKLLEQKINQLNEEDANLYDQVPTQNNATEHLTNQLKTYTQLADIRYNMERIFQNIKKIPNLEYSVQNEELAEKAEEATQACMRNLQHLKRITQKIAQKCNVTVDLNSQQYEQFLNQSQPVTKIIEEGIVKWSNKTALLSQLSQSNYSSLIMQTPVGQANKVMNNLDKVIHKHQMKRGVFKTLFHPPEDIRQSHNPQIFDDFQLFHMISQSFQKHIENDEQDGLLVGASRRFLAQRNSKISQKKEVDRKASKNRKIRYNVHAKLVNFMASQDNPYLLQARDDIIKNIFNIGKNHQVVDYIDL